LIRAYKKRITAEVGKQPQLDLRVIRRQQLRARCGDESRPDLTPQFGFDGNVLQVGIEGRESSGRSCSGLERGVHARVRVGLSWENVDVGGFELGEMPVFENEANHFEF